MISRAEENGLLLWNFKRAITSYLSGEELAALKRYLLDGKDTGFIRRLQLKGILEEYDREDLLNQIEISNGVTAPLRSLSAPESLHIELTNICPLGCSQCYNKSVLESRMLAFEILKDILVQASDMRVFQIAFGGGEPLTYPYLEKAISFITKLNMSCSVTSSGYLLSKEMLKALVYSGLNHIQISLNASKESINKQSRDGYQYAVQALKLLANETISFGINWVARQDNLDDLPQLILLAKRFHANNINILRYKPSNREDYKKVSLNHKQQVWLADFLRSVRGIRIKLDSSNSNMLCYINKTIGFMSGCGAGRRFLAINAEGKLGPCSHVPYFSKSLCLNDYWYQSQELNRFRKLEDEIGEPCFSCPYISGCRGCAAIRLAESMNPEDGERDCFLSVVRGIH